MIFLVKQLWNLIRTLFLFVSFIYNGIFRFIMRYTLRIMIVGVLTVFIIGFPFYVTGYPFNEISDILPALQKMFSYGFYVFRIIPQYCTDIWGGEWVFLKFFVGIGIFMCLLRFVLKKLLGIFIWEMPLSEFLEEYRMKLKNIW